MSAALDLESIFEDAQAHVMLSRVQPMDQVFIVEKFSESKIRTPKTAMEEMRRLENISMNKNHTPWESIGKQRIKVVTLNCAGLKAHTGDLKTDDKLLKADIIHLVETSLDVNKENPLKINGYETHDCSVGNGMGITTYFKHNLLESKVNYVTSEIQVAKLTSEHLVVINTYRSSRGSLVVLQEKIKKMVAYEEKAILITGDFNVCYMSNKKNQFSKELESIRFEQLIKNPTHIQGGHIDHVYWRGGSRTWIATMIEMYSPFYSDHDASHVTITGNY